MFILQLPIQCVWFHSKHFQRILLLEMDHFFSTNMLLRTYAACIDTYICVHSTQILPTARIKNTLIWSRAAAIKKVSLSSGKGRILCQQMCSCNNNHRMLYSFQLTAKKNQRIFFPYKTLQLSFYLKFVHTRNRESKKNTMRHLNATIKCLKWETCFS